MKATACTEGCKVVTARTLIFEYLAHSCKKNLKSDSLINAVTVGLVARIATDKDGDGGYLTRVWNWQSRTEQGITGIVHTIKF